MLLLFLNSWLRHSTNDQPLKIFEKSKKNGATNFSRVIPNVLKTKTKLQLIFVEGKPMKLLNDNLQERLNRCNFQINEDRLMIG